MTTVCDLVKSSDIGSATGLLHDLSVRGGIAMMAPIKLVRGLPPFPLQQKTNAGGQLIIT
jgi:hypothetical protein